MEIGTAMLLWLSSICRHVDILYSKIRQIHELTWYVLFIVGKKVLTKLQKIIQTKIQQNDKMCKDKSNG
jgi:hypothetical protein